jgi:hypothetical protein
VSTEYSVNGVLLYSEYRSTRSTSVPLVVMADSQFVGNFHCTLFPSRLPNIQHIKLRENTTLDTGESMKILIVLFWLLRLADTTSAWVNPKAVASKTNALSAWFSAPTETTTSLDVLKAQILQLGAALDRGQAYNPTSGEYYKDTMDVAKSKVLSLLEQHPNKIPKTLEEMAGEWELVLTTVPHGIFRSSPFFLAVQDAFQFAEEKGEYLRYE